MRSKILWIVSIGLDLVVLIFLPSLLMGRFWLWRYGGMMGSGMMGSFGYINPLGFFGMVLMWLVPIALVVLLILGIAALMKSLTKPTNPIQPASGRVCANCGKSAQADWITCPYCGTLL